MGPLDSFKSHLIEAGQEEKPSFAIVKGSLGKHTVYYGASNTITYPKIEENISRWFEGCRTFEEKLHLFRGIRALNKEIAEITGEEKPDKEVTLFQKFFSSTEALPIEALSTTLFDKISISPEDLKKLIEAGGHLLQEIFSKTKGDTSKLETKIKNLTSNTEALNKLYLYKLFSPTAEAVAKCFQGIPKEELVSFKQQIEENNVQIDPKTGSPKVFTTTPFTPFPRFTPPSSFSDYCDACVKWKGKAFETMSFLHDAKIALLQAIEFANKENQVSSGLSSLSTYIDSLISTYGNELQKDPRHESLVQFLSKDTGSNKWFKPTEWKRGTSILSTLTVPENEFLQKPSLAKLDNLTEESLEEETKKLMENFENWKTSISASASSIDTKFSEYADRLKADLRTDIDKAKKYSNHIEDLRDICDLTKSCNDKKFFSPEQRLAIESFLTTINSGDYSRPITRPSWPPDPKKAVKETGHQKLYNKNKAKMEKALTENEKLLDELHKNLDSFEKILKDPSSAKGYFSELREMIREKIEEFTISHIELTSSLDDEYVKALDNTRIFRTLQYVLYHKENITEKYDDIFKDPPPTEDELKDLKHALSVIKAHVLPPGSPEVCTNIFKSVTERCAKLMNHLEHPTEQ